MDLNSKRFFMFILTIVIKVLARYQAAKDGGMVTVEAASQTRGDVRLVTLTGADSDRLWRGCRQPEQVTGPAATSRLTTSRSGDTPGSETHQ